MRAKDVLGAYGEDLAARYLRLSGLTVLERNWRCPAGEIDLVVVDGDVLVFCEVKTRSGSAFGRPEEAVVRQKAERLRGLALRWLAAHPGRWREVRFDVVSVLWSPDAPAVDHIRGAF